MHIFTHKCSKSAIVFLALLFISFYSFAQVPVNDDPCGAIVLTPTAGCSYATFTNVDATNSATVGVPDPVPFITCGAYLDADVWFKVTVPVGATNVIIDTKNLVMADGAMTVYTATGSCPTLTMTQVACIDDGSINPGMPKLTLTNAPGTVLYIRMYGVSGETGTFGICVTANIPPVNDDCNNAIALSINPDYNCGIVSTGNTTINATQSANTPIPTCSSTGINDDVWFSFVALGANHRVSLSDITAVGTGMSMQIYSGTCATLTTLVCTTTNSIDLTGLTAGDNYLVRVYTTTATNTTRASFTICVGTLPPPPANDECAGAINLTVNPTLTCTVVQAGTTQSATQSAGAPTPTCGNANAFNDDVWYTFTATSTSHRVSLSNIVAVGTGMVLTVYSGTCAALTEIGCSTTTSPLALFGLTVGDVYYVRVFTNTSTATTVANFDICVTTPPPPPANDECVAAITLTVNPDYLCGVTTIGNTLSATPSSTAPTPSCSVFNAFNDDVWYSFTATNTRHRVVVSAITGFTSLTTVVYSGTCAALTELTCRNINTYDVTGLTIGSTYYIRVFTNTAIVTSEATSFTLCIGSPPPPPANDNCAGAINLGVNADLLCGLFTQATITSATASGTLPVPSCGATGVDDDVWFKFTATNGIHQINISNILPATGMTAAVYSGTCAGLTELICNQTNLFNVSGLTIGDVYYVRVYSTGTVANLEVDFRICVGTPPPPPPNDECLGAVSLTVNPTLACTAFTTGTTISAVQSTTLPIPSCAPANSWNDDVWYKFVALAPIQRITLNSITGSTDLITTVYSGTCAALTQVACSDPEVFNVAGLVVGDTYYVRVFTKSTSLTTYANTFNICVSSPQPPANDECTGAIPLTINSNLTCATSLQGTTVGATLSVNLPTPSCAVTNAWNDDVWYSFVATSTSHRVTLLNITGLTTNMVTAVYSGTCGALAQVACNTANTFDVGNLVIGNTYYIRVLTANSTPEDASFNICIGSPAPNLTCETSIPFCNQISNEVNYASTQGIQVGGPIGCLFTTPNRNWYDIYVSTAGPIFIEISQTGGNVSNDVDFTSWGPFTSPTDACIQIASGAAQQIVNIPAAPNCTIASTQGGCSYSIAAIEYFKIPNALPGQVYKLLVTNYSTSNNNLPPFTTPGQFVKLKSLTTIGPGTGATLDCNLTCFNSTATNSGPICPGGTFNLFSTGSTTPFAWTGPSGFTSSVQNPTGIVASTTPGNYVYTVTIGTGTSACIKSTTVVVQSPPPAPIVSATPVTYCQGATNAIALTATALAGNTLHWYTLPTGGAWTATLIPSTAATNTYYVSQITSGGCEGPRTPLTVTIIPAPAAPAAANPAPYCQFATAVPLTATATGSNTLLWYTTPTGGTGVASITPLTTAVGTTLYYVSQITGNCESLRTTVTVTVKLTPAPPVPTNTLYCQGVATLPVTATGVVAGATLAWYTTLTGGVAIATPTPSNAATSTYYVTQILNGCESSPRVLLTTTITPTPAAPIVGASPIYCQGATAVALTATATAGNTLLWYTTPTGGVGVTTLIPGTAATNTYYVSQVTSVALGGCEGPRTPLVVTITPTPLAPAVVNPAPYCQFATAVPLTATATGTNTLLYYTVPTGGTGVTSFTPPTTAVGSITYYVSQVTSTATGGCEGPRAAITVTVKLTPAPPVPTNTLYCQGVATLPVTATGVVAGATLAWYTTLTGGVAIATPTPSNAATSTYYVTQILNGCESSPRVLLTTTITPTPVKPIVVSPIKYCPGDPASPLTATALPGNTLLWYATAIGGVGNSTATIPITTAPGSFNFYVSQVTDPAIGGCEGPRELIVVNVNNNNLSVYIGKDTTICEGKKVSFTPIVSPVASSYEWRVIGVPINTISNTLVKDITVSTVDTAQYILKATVGGCSVEDSVNVNVLWKPLITTKGNIAICTSDSIIIKGIVSHNSSDSIDFVWTPNINLATANSLNTWAKPPLSTKYILTYITKPSYGCAFTDSTSMKLVIQPIVKAFAGNDTIAATGLPHQLHGEGGLNYTWTAITSLSASSITNANKQNAFITLTQDANILLKVTDAIGCAGYDEIFVKVLNGPTYHIPNAFTPNGDGLNDIFRAIPAGMSNTTFFRVINRWGEVVFETNQWLKGWDGTFRGKPAPNGVYVWMVKGTDKNYKKVEMQGTVNLIR
jgi:gliding motility-associated-like protein